MALDHHSKIHHWARCTPNIFPKLMPMFQRRGISAFRTAVMSHAGGVCYTSIARGIYGSDVVERSYWGGGDYSSWLDLTNSLPPGLLQRYYVFAQPSAHTDNVGTAVVRIQVWRPVPSAHRAFQLVWQRRILLLPCDHNHGALHTVIKRLTVLRGTSHIRVVCLSVLSLLSPEFLSSHNIGNI